MKTKQDLEPCICGSFDHRRHPTSTPDNQKPSHMRIGMDERLNQDQIHKPSHTPTPWKLQGVSAWHDGFKDRGNIFSCNLSTGTHVPNEQNYINAAYIVQCANHFDSLVNVLGRIANEDMGIHHARLLAGEALNDLA